MQLTPPRWFVCGLGALLGVAAIAYLTLKVAPDLFASDPTCPLDKSFSDCLELAKARADSRRGVTTASLAILAGVLSAAGVFITARTFSVNRQNARESHELDRSGQITERFTRAIDQLGSDKIDVTLGGIYALERLARDSREDHPQIVEVLTAYLRQHASWRPSDPAAGGENRPSGLAVDVQAVMSVLGRREASQDQHQTLSLARCNFRDLVLAGADENRVANFENANLGGANLQRAHLGEVNLDWARLIDAQLQGAELRNVSLQGTALSAADLEGVIFDGVNLQAADLTGANLTSVDFGDADLRGAHLGDSMLEGSYLKLADLRDAEFVGATYDENTVWPDDFDVAASGAQISIPI